jgi:uncharacterized protein YdbL (DUF1318 family)
MVRAKVKMLRTVAAAAVMTLGAAEALAQSREPAYAAARAAGAVGERPDGYLGIVGNADPGLRRVVEDINIRRRAVYAREARASNASIEEFAFATGCFAIAQTRPGERYMGPDGVWRTRGEGPLVRDPRCP